MNGTLLIAGGNIGATEQGKKEIFSRFAELCGGKSAKVVLAVCASSDPEDSFSANRELLLEAGVGQVALLPLTEQPDLVGRNSWTNRADQSVLPVLEGAGGIWFGGGDQLRTARLLLQADGTDTPVLAAMRRLLDGGGGPASRHGQQQAAIRGQTQTGLTGAGGAPHARRKPGAVGKNEVRCGILGVRREGSGSFCRHDGRLPQAWGAVKRRIAPGALLA